MPDPLNTLFKIRQTGRIGKADMLFRPVAAKISPGRNRHTGFIEQRLGKLKTVLGEPAASGIEIKGPSRHHRDIKPQ